MEEQQQLKEIFQRYINKECTEQEIKLLLEHFKIDAHETVLRDIIAKKLNEFPVEDLEPSPQISRRFDDMFAGVMSKIDETEATKPESEGGQKNTLSFLFKAIAGIFIILIVFQSIYYYNKSVNKTDVTANNKGVKAGILPGSNKAILTLQDGSKIVLNDAKDGVLAHQGSTKVVKLNSGQLVYDKTGGVTQKGLLNTMTTPRGGQYKLTLPDGTDVWLNASSSITYPTAFVGKERNVSITGEAYFEVAKDKTRPFHVIAGNQTIEVLGTHFNVMAYADESVIKTTLLEGSVKIKGDNGSGILKPGEQGVLDKSGSLTISPALTDEAIAWKNGYFKFDRVDIKYIMRQLARWYDVDVVYDGHVKTDEFVGTISRGENIVQALHLLELTNVHFKIRDKKIIVLAY